jgi:predicted nucleotidyltransferase
MQVEHLMTRDDLIERIAASRSQWASFGVSAIFVFGSAARNEAREQSDVDLLVDFERPVGLLEFLQLRRVLSDLVGRPVVLVTRAALKPQLRDRILAEAIRAA